MRSSHGLDRLDVDFNDHRLALIRMSIMTPALAAAWRLTMSTHSSILINRPLLRVPASCLRRSLLAL